MIPYIALFRGINVGGNNVLPMRELVVLLEALGCRDCKTYIQSGNAVFVSAERDASRLSRKIGAEIRKRRGFEPSILLLGIADLRAAIRNNPFPEALDDPKSLHVGFLAAKPKKPDLQALDALRKDSERFRLSGRTFYLHAPEGIARSKLAANAERHLGVSLTDRNWRTVGKVMEMATALGNP